MSVLVRVAPKRSASKLLIGMVGESYGGKTHSAIELALGLADGGLIVAVDTEEKRMLQSDAVTDAARGGKFDYYQFPEPWTPDRYVTMLEEVAALKPAVCILDSGSHEWRYAGGVLEQAEQAGAFSGNTGAWRIPKAKHERFMNRLRAMPCHMIVCLRAKRKIQFVDRTDPDTGKVIRGQNGKPKQDIVDLGIQPIQSQDFVFEMTVQMVLRKERPGVPDRSPGMFKCPGSLLSAFPEGQRISRDTGVRMRAWLTETTADEDRLAGLRSRASAAAAQGYSALQTWWQSGIGSEDRKLLAPFKEALKAEAAQADLANSGTIADERATPDPDELGPSFGPPLPSDDEIERMAGDGGY